MKIIKRFIKNLFRKKSRVYIMPTSMGWYLIGLILLIFLLGVGYSNNLLLGLGLFLSSLGLFWLIEAHFWMQNFKFDGLHLADAEAGNPLMITIKGSHPQGDEFFTKLNHELELLNGESFKINFSNQLRHIIVKKRGLFKTEFIKFGSSGFLGLFYSWRFFKIDQKFWVYPVKHFNMIHYHLPSTNDESVVSVVKNQERDHHRPYVPGDDAKRIDWKRLAKSEDLFVFVGEENRGLDDITIEILTSSPTLEADLSDACYLIGTLFEANRKWTLIINGQSSGQGTASEVFLRESLRRLAEC